MKIQSISTCFSLPIKAVEITLSGLSLIVQMAARPVFALLRALGCSKPLEHAVHIPTILGFYRGARNDRGYTLEDIWAFDDKAKEAKHDFIQWLFPTKTVGMNPTAPLTNAKTIAAFRKDAKLQSTMRKSFTVMLNFYGFKEGLFGSIEKGAHFSQQASNWLHPGNHNHLRITRILTSLRLHGLEKEAKGFFAALERLYREDPTKMGEATFDYWKKAANG